MIKQQQIKPVNGIDLDTDNSLVSPDKARLLKNAQTLFNTKGLGNVGANQLAITPIQSNATDFDLSLLPRICTYTIDLTSLNVDFPLRLYSYTKDYVEIEGETIADTSAMDTFMTGLGFSTTGTTLIYTISSPNIWGAMLFGKDASTQINFVKGNCSDDTYGVNFTIGSYYDRKLNQMFWFNYNTLQRHHILMYDATTEQYYNLFETPTLNFSYEHRISSIDLVEANVIETQNTQVTVRLLYWTDGYNPPRKVNVDKCLSGEYWDVLPLWYRTEDEWMMAVKYPPENRIVPTSFRDENTKYNYTINKNFQFRYRYLYEDGEYSVYSPISTLMYPEDTTNIITLAGNAIQLSNIDVGSKIVKKVELCFRIGNTTDFKTFDIIEKSKIINDVQYQYDITNNTFIYNFYNNYAYTIVPQELSTKLYDVHPLKAYTQEMLTNNTLSYGNILEGYDNLNEDELNKPDIDIEYYNNIGTLELTVVDFSASWSTFPAAFTSTWEIVREYNGGMSEDILGQFIYDDTTPPLPDFVATCYQYNEGDRFYFRLSSVSAGVVITISPLLQFTGNYTLNSSLPCGTGDFDVSTTAIQVMAVGDKVHFDGVTSDTCSTWSITDYWHTTPNYGYNAHLKQGGEYQFGFVLHDEALRSTYIQTTEQLKLYVKTPMEFPPTTTEGRAQKITFNFNGCVFPDWVKYVSIYRTKNNNINRENGLGFIQWEIDNVSSSANNISFDINTLQTFNTTNLQQTTTTYTFTDGDVVRFLTIAANIPNKIIDRQLKSTDSINFTIDYDSELASVSGGDIIEIYTPQQQRNTDIFYEISSLIPTTGEQGNNQSSQSSVMLNTFDTYFVSRLSLSAYEPFESPSRSDTIINSHGEDIGRLNIVNPTAKQVWKPSLVRYSYVYNPESFINGLSTFDSYRDKLYYRQFGGITSLVCINNELNIIQEDNVFKSTIAKAQIRYADGSTALITADQILSDPLDVVGDYGCQDGSTVIAKDGFIYFWDIKRGVVVRHDGNKQEPISSLGASSFIQHASKYIIRNADEREQMIVPHAGYDPKYNSFIITGFQYNPNSPDVSHIENSDNVPANGVFTLAWDMDNQVWRCFYGFVPECYSFVDGSKLGTLLTTFRYGIPYYHNLDSVNTYNTFYGIEVNQVVDVVMNIQPQSVKTPITMGYESNYAYAVTEVVSATEQASIIPIVSFAKKEGMWWSNFFRDRTKGGTIANGNPLKGSWIRTKLVKNSSDKTKYDELKRIFYNFTTSEKTLK